MNKAECRKYAGEPLRIRANSGLLCADQIEWLTTARVRVIGHRRILVLQVYSRAGAAQGDLLPKWTVFQQKDDYLTLERREDGTASWRTACFERLSPNWNFVSRCAFLTQSDRKCISRFFHDDTQDGFGCLTAHQKLIQENRRQVRQRKERRRINARMQSVPPVPRGLKRWLYRKIMPAYFFYDAMKGRKTVPGVCSACGREISLSGVRYNGNALCPSCGRELIMKSRGRMGNLFDRETCQVIQRTAPDEVVVRVFKARPLHSEQIAAILQPGCPSDCGVSGRILSHKRVNCPRVHKNNWKFTGATYSAGACHRRSCFRPPERSSVCPEPRA